MGKQGEWDDSAFLDDGNPFMIAGDTDDDDIIDTPFVEKKAVPKTKAKPPVYQPPSTSTGSDFKSSSRNDAASSTFADEVVSAELLAKQEDLKKREAALEERERNAELIVQRHNKNYPPFPAFCCLKPWVYHNIQDELPEGSWTRQKAYWVYWHFHWITMTLNILGAVAQMQLGGVAHIGLEGPLVSLIFSIIYWLAFTYIGFYLLYRSLYIGIKDGSSFRLVVHLGTQVLHVCYTLYMSVGVYHTGGAGFIGAVDLWNTGHHFSSSFLFCLAIAWFFDAAVGVVFFLLHYRFFKANGHSLAEAQSQALSSAASNKAVRDATFTIAESAIKTSASQSA